MPYMEGGPSWGQFLQEKGFEINLSGHFSGDTLDVEEHSESLALPPSDAIPSSPYPTEPYCPWTHISQHAPGAINSPFQPTPTSSAPVSSSSPSTTNSAASRFVRKTYEHQVRIPCAQYDEPGCPMLFGSKRERDRHRKESCEKLAQRTFRCCCGRSVKRWANFRKSHSSCSPDKGCVFQCHCEFDSDTFERLEHHYVAAHMGKKGRPRGAYRNESLE